ncbi:MAG TPA: polynucleotide adenylyltransferase PcnB [Polyangiaceae bacterium]|nr:polynucleotide adenylyltransferase PcnB [Polyangiaceae bacterium]
MPDDDLVAAVEDEEAPPAGGEGPEPTVHPMELGDGRIDADAEKVVRRLVRHGFEAYLVGGCVRDLLLDRSPKDFDVATSARPDDVRQLFRNSRIIGRRFRLVHVLFGGGKVIETATFRRTPAEDREGEDLLIRSDNVFGDAHEDAYRRDFTINGLFYDIERRAVLDWVSGMPDIEGRVVRTIGNPVVRFREDPVRILRAIKFSARADLAIAEEVYDAIVVCRDSLALAARPRLFEEMLRLMRGGAAHRSFWLAWETGVLAVLLPELAAYLSDADGEERPVWRILDAIDRSTRDRGAPLEDSVLWTLLLLEPLREACEGARDRVAAAFDFLEPIVERLAVPRRIADAMRRIVAALPRLESGRAGRMAKTALFSTASEVLAIYQAAREGEATMAPAALPEAQPGNADRPARRRRRRRRKPGAEATPPVEN